MQQTQTIPPQTKDTKCHVCHDGIIRPYPMHVENSDTPEWVSMCGNCSNLGDAKIIAQNQRDNSQTYECPECGKNTYGLKPIKGPDGKVFHEVWECKKCEYVPGY